MNLQVVSQVFKYDLCKIHSINNLMEIFCGLNPKKVNIGQINPHPTTICDRKAMYWGAFIKPKTRQFPGGWYLNFRYQYCNKWFELISKRHHSYVIIVTSSFWRMDDLIIVFNTHFAEKWPSISTSFEFCDNINHSMLKYAKWKKMKFRNRNSSICTVNSLSSIPQFTVFICAFIS